MQTAKKLVYSSAGGAIKFANPGPVTNLLLLTIFAENTKLMGLPYHNPLFVRKPTESKGPIMSSSMPIKRGKKLRVSFNS
jgi:hypothetical protein